MTEIMENTKKGFKDPGSAITHFIALIMTVFAAYPLLFKAQERPGALHLLCMYIFIFSMTGLYAASTIYHTFDAKANVNQVLQKLDHCAIFILIAGSYTPVCVLVLRQPTGIRLCIASWAIALVGIIVKIFWITSPKWFSSVLYIGMGWVCVTAFHSLVSDLSPSAFLLLLSGGLVYTAGGVIYALKLPLFNSRHSNFGTHEIFHLFVMAGSVCHYILMYDYVV